MGEQNNTQSQIEKLIELANQLEERELALNKESDQLEQLRTALDERERKLSSAAAEPAEENSESILKEHPLFIPREEEPLPEPLVKPAPDLPAKPKARQAVKPLASAETITEINDILKSIFWDYSNSVHQISSQLSTVTAAMMCAAVTCVLEDRGFDAKEVFLEEMDKMLKSGGFGEVSSAPPKPAQPASADTQTAAHTAAPAVSLTGRLPDDGDDGEDTETPADTQADAPKPAKDGVLHIADAAAFAQLGEYGFRNDETIVRVILPEGVEKLPGSFFYGCSKLEEVTLPDSLREIEPYAFYGCEALKQVRIGEASQLREIGEYAFAMCAGLESFAVPGGVERLGTSVFRFCSSLQKLSFVKGGKLSSIGSHLLQNCTSLEKLRLPKSIDTIPTSAFYGCSALRKVVAKGVDTIEDYAFYGNKSLHTIRIRGKKAIAPQAFEGCDPELEIEYLNY